MSKTKKPPVDRAIATFRSPRTTDVEKITLARRTSQAMQSSPDWATATDVQSAVQGWTADAAAMEANAKVLSALRQQIKTGEAKQNSLRRDWQASARQVLSTVTKVCGGSADRVKSFALDVQTRTRPGALVAPADVGVNPARVAGGVVVSWTRGSARHGFLVQHATDPTNLATFSTAVACTKAKLALSGMPPGATVSCRVAAIDPASATGQTPWSAWVVGNAP